MKKKVIIPMSIVAILVLAVGCAYLIDKSRMNSNKPIIFSNWGYSYVPPIEGEDITNKVLNLPEDNATISITTKENETLLINLLDGWKYEVSVGENDEYEYAIKFYTFDEEHRMILYAYKNLFGVCGTGLETKNITLDDGNIASVGYYDGSERWTFINFGDNIVAQNGGLTLEEANEALSMFKTMKFVETFPGNISKIKRTFIATIIQEEPTYLIVEPKDGELEKLQSNTRKILIANGENRDYFYGVGRKVIITYDNLIQSDTNIIVGAEIDVDGYDDFEFKVIESENMEKRKILNNRDLDKLNSDYDLYYYGLDEVEVRVDDKEMTLENALRDGYLTLSGILSKANKDVKAVQEQYAKYEEYQSVPLILPRDIRYDDGGSVEFQYENFVIIKSNTIDGNNAMYICKAGTSLKDLNKENNT